MQALSNFPWLSEFMHGQSQREKMACTKGHSIDMSLFTLGKRKRADSAASTSSADVAPAKKLKAEARQHKAADEYGATLRKSTAPGAGPTARASADVAKHERPSQAHRDSAEPMDLSERDSVDVAKPAKPVPDKAQVQQAVEAQLNLEILMKHQELRLIEQELAKCQVSLEQLRRCQLIPFPGETGSPVGPEDVRGGVGHALEPLRGFSHPQYPAPWGVTDGPYTQHYARWLIPDPAFDPSPILPARTSVGGKSVSARHVAERGSLHSPRSQRGSLSSPFSAVPSAYAPPREVHVTSIVTRPSDGKKVRLVCKKCQKDDHRTIQGFLNHCRIAHGLEYKSHSAAAEDCGVPVDESELPPTPPLREQSVPLPPAALSSPISGKPLVHPLITGPRKPQHRPSSSLNSPITPSPLHASFTHTSALATNSAPSLPTVKKNANKSFVPSSQTPRLSALLSKRGIGGDLDSAVTAAKDRREYDAYMSQPDENDDDEDEHDAPSTSAKGSGVPGTANTAAKPVHKNKNKLGGVRVPARTTAPSRLQLAPAAMDTDDAHSQHSGASSAAASPALSGRSRQLPITPEDESDAHMDLSPHTVDTNPGLITDNDDDVDYEESISHPSDESIPDDDLLHVRVHDHEAMDLDRRGSSGEGPAAAADEPKMAIPPPRLRGSHPAHTVAPATPAATPPAANGEKRRRGRPSKRGGKA